MYKHLFRALLFSSTIAITACGPSDENNATENNATTENNSSMTIDKEAQRMEFDTCVAENADTTTYTPFETSISTAARVAAFETMGDKTWRNEDLTGTDFEEANLAYVEDEGLDSRVSRREDEHYPAVTDDAGETVKCNESDEIADANPDRCVGPAQMRPIIVDSLTAGATSTDTQEQKLAAARLESTLLWFFYVSTFKEATTCTSKKKDCDSSFGYYTGVQDKDMGLGLSGYFIREVPEAHDAVWDGIMQMRCWRQVDSTDTAQNLELRDEALSAMDHGLLYGISRLITARLESLADATDDEKAVTWQWLQIMGPVLDRSAAETDATKATTLREAFAQESPEGVDAAALVTTIEELFPSAS